MPPKRHAFLIDVLRNPVCYLKHNLLNAVYALLDVLFRAFDALRPKFTAFARGRNCRSLSAYMNTVRSCCRRDFSRLDVSWTLSGVDRVRRSADTMYANHLNSPIAHP